MGPSRPRSAAPRTIADHLYEVISPLCYLWGYDIDVRVGWRDQVYRRRTPGFQTVVEVARFAKPSSQDNGLVFWAISYNILKCPTAKQNSHLSVLSSLPLLRWPAGRQAQWFGPWWDQTVSSYRHYSKSAMISTSVWCEERKDDEPCDEDFLIVLIVPSWVCAA